MKFNLLTAAAVAVVLGTAGCDTGGRSGGKAVFGPGSTGGIAQQQTNGSTNPGSTGGGGGGGGTAGNFSAGPSMNVARYQHTATLMNDGRVLVVGGTDGQGLSPESEVFDPTTNTWELVSAIAPTANDGYMIDATGQFATIRQLHTATALVDGRVLVAGGFGAERLDQQGAPLPEMLKSAYAFNPQTNSFAAVGEMSENRGYHQAALLSTGAVLATAGLDQQLAATLKTADLFDPNTDTWTSVNPGTSGAHTWGVTETAINQTLVIAGCDVVRGQQGLSIQGFPQPRVEVFNVQNQVFQNGPDNVGDRIDEGHNRMSTGNIFLAGGMGLDPQGQQLIITDTTEFYDANSQSFQAGPTLQVPRSSCRVAEIGTTADQLIIGGIDGSGMPTPVCEVWSFVNNTIVSSTVSMAQERVDHRAVTLNDGRILVVGGQDANGNALDTSEVHTR